MPEPDPLSRISYLYYFTDRRNLALIREMGGLLPLSGWSVGALTSRRPAVMTAAVRLTGVVSSSYTTLPLTDPPPDDPGRNQAALQN
jgi:hypothetical protein